MKEFKILNREIKPEESERRLQEKVETQNTEPKPMKEKVDEMYSAWTIGKKREIKIPRKAKVRKRKLKKGWIGILKIDENGNISGEKQKVSGFSFKTKDSLTHSTDGREILFWNGKFPVILQPSWKENPLLIKKDITGNETYGQPYVQARMMGDMIKIKKGGGKILIWLLVLGAIFLIAKYVFKLF